MGKNIFKSSLSYNCLKKCYGHHLSLEPVIMRTWLYSIVYNIGTLLEIGLFHSDNLK